MKGDLNESVYLFSECSGTKAIIWHSTGGDILECINYFGPKTRHKVESKNY